MSKIPSTTLSDGSKFPLLGLGTYGSEASGDREKVEQAVYDAISVGYRHIDTAWVYRVEGAVGSAIKRAIEDGLVQRSDLYVVTKVWSVNFKRDQVIASARESLRNLRLDYVDLLLVHWPVAMKDDGKGSMFPTDEAGNPLIDDTIDIHGETWKAFEECVKQGLTKSIGISNYNKRQIESLFASGLEIKPVVNQVESHPLLSQKKLLDVCTKHGIVLTAYSAFGGSPKYDAAADKWYDHPVKVELMNNEFIKSLAAKYNKTVSQILLKFHTARNVAVIPKTVTKSRMIENMSIFDFDLTKDEITQLESMDKGARTVLNEKMSGSKNYPFNDEY